MANQAPLSHQEANAILVGHLMEMISCPLDITGTFERNVMKAAS